MNRASRADGPLTVWAIALSALSACAARTPPALSEPTVVAAASADEGRTAFLNVCAGCHGEDALGGMAPPLVPTQRSAEALIEIVRTGRGVMPPLDPSLIADDEVAEVAAFLRSLSQ